MRFPNSLIKIYHFQFHSVGSNKLIKLFDLETFLYVELIESRKIVI